MFSVAFESIIALALMLWSGAKIELKFFKNFKNFITFYFIF